MQISKTPAQFANRADMQECDKFAFSVGADIPERRVCVNLYAADGTRVISMTPEEAQDFARAIQQGADDARKGAQEARHAAETAAQSDRVVIAGNVQGEPIYNVETADSGTFQVFKTRVWKILHAGKLRELTWKTNERAITRACGAVARFKQGAADATKGGE